MAFGLGFGFGLSLSGSRAGEPPEIELDDLTDVVITTPSNGDELVFDGSDWINE